MGKKLKLLNKKNFKNPIANIIFKREEVQEHDKRLSLTTFFLTLY